MDFSYFLGANSGEGFHSLYGAFPPEAQDYLHIIKGGPGTGKSSFMRKLGEAASRRGLDVEYVLCSGDPASLDGVYVPALHCAWVDGTAPHVIDVGKFGVDSDYINLGQFCRTPLSGRDAGEAAALCRLYKEQYARAYALLRAAREVKSAGFAALPYGEIADTVSRRTDSLAKRSVLSGASRERRLYLSAVSCSGRLRLTEEIRKRCDRIYAVDDFYGEAELVMRMLSGKARSAGTDMIVCPSPVDPQRIEALLFPAAGFALISWEPEDAVVKHIRLDALLSDAMSREARKEYRRLCALSEELLRAAELHLREAKALHDRLELLYRSYMDFPALSEFTEEYLSFFPAY